MQTLNYLTSGGESRALNLGTGQGHSIRQVIAVVEDITGCKVQFRISSQRAGDPAILVADPSLAAKVLGRRPQHSGLENIVRTAWRWHSRNRSL